MSRTRNHWGHPVTTPLEAIQTASMADALRNGITRIFREFLLPHVVIEELTRQVWDAARDSTMEGFDRRLQKLLVGSLDEEKIRTLLDQRAHHVARQITPHLQGRSLLDVGAGDGMVAWAVRSHFEEQLLSDVLDYRDRRVPLPFVLCPEGKPLPVPDASHDTVILTNVLHHALNPGFLLEQSIRAARRRLVIIESVFGDPARSGGETMPFCLPVETQFVYTSFFDWFYNRVLHSDVAVPFNFLPPPAWEADFKARGLTLHTRQDLGIDVEIVPIHHYLYVLDKARPA